MKITAIDATAQPLDERSGRKIRILLDEVLGGTNIQVMTVEYPPGLTTKENHQHQTTQTIYVLEGVLTIEDETGAHHVKAGSLINIPAGVPHRHSNYENRPLKKLVIWNPAGKEVRGIRQGSAPSHG